MNALHKDTHGGWCCLKCRALTECSSKILVPGDDTPTYLSLGQREEVYCPVCQDMKTCEWQEITHMNANRVVDAMGRPKQVLVQSPAFVSPQQQVPQQQYPTVINAPSATAAGGGISHMQLPMPSPLNSSNQLAVNSSPALMASDLFEKHVHTLSDDQVRQLRSDLTSKLTLVEKALGERRKCIICCDREKSVVLMPCKHSSMCQPCSEKVNECPVCKAAIQDRIVPFSS